MSTLQLRLPLRRRLLRRVVIAALSACALILVAAGITRVVHASSEPDHVARASASSGNRATPAIAPSTAGAASASGATAAQGTSAAGANEAASAVGTSAAPSGGTGTPQSAPMTGSLHLERNLTPRWVLLDGKKLTSRTEVVACGPHQIKVGPNRAHPIDIPCGGELSVAR
jgi:hypothetical protein